MRIYWDFSGFLARKQHPTTWFYLPTLMSFHWRWKINRPPLLYVYWITKSTKLKWFNKTSMLAFPWKVHSWISSSVWLSLNMFSIENSGSASQFTTLIIYISICLSIDIKPWHLKLGCYLSMTYISWIRPFKFGLIILFPEITVYGSKGVRFF